MDRITQDRVGTGYIEQSGVGVEVQRMYGNRVNKTGDGSKRIQNRRGGGTRVGCKIIRRMR